MTHCAARAQAQTAIRSTCGSKNNLLEPLPEKDFLGELNQDRPGNRVLFSCRSLDYGASLSSRDLPVPQVRIEPLSDAQVRRFLELYCPKHAAALWHNLDGSRQLELLRSPYYLKLLVDQTTEGEIPEGRAALFTGFVRQSLRREVEADHPLFRPDELLTQRDCQRLINVRRWPIPYELPSEGILFGKLSTLAYQMQVQRSEREAGQVRVAYHEALAILDHKRGNWGIRASSSARVRTVHICCRHWWKSRAGFTPLAAMSGSTKTRVQFIPSS